MKKYSSNIRSGRELEEEICKVSVKFGINKVEASRLIAREVKKLDRFK